MTTRATTPTKSTRTKATPAKVIKKNAAAKSTRVTKTTTPAKKTTPAGGGTRITPGPIGPDVDLDTDDIRDTHGRRITEAYTATVIATARAGRPSLTGDGRHSPHVSFRVPADIRAAAEARAATEGKTVSRLAREALEAYLR